MDADQGADADGDKASLIPRSASTEPNVGLKRHRASNRSLNRSASSVAGALRRDASGLMLLRTRSHAGDLHSWVEGDVDEEQNVALETALEEIDGLATEPSPEDRPVATFFGFDQRPLLPVLLYVSVCLGALQMLTMHWRLWAKVISDSSRFPVFFGALYCVTIGCMFFVGFSDPGMLAEELWRRVQAGESNMPLRSHKNWHCRRPILRFDHYCRWVNNCIGLWNHRQFLVMCAGFVMISVCGACADSLLFVVLMWRYMWYNIGFTWWAWFKILCHLAYSMLFAVVAVPIFRLHIGFISRNELAYEWKNDLHYVVFNARGQKVPVADLDVDEYNEKFDDFVYEPTLNKFDRGLTSNLKTFWLTPRTKPSGEMGEF